MKTDYDTTVRIYGECLKSSFGMVKATGEEGLDRIRATGRRLWTALKNARVYHLDLEDYGRIYRFCDIYTTEEIAGLPFLAPEDPEAVASDEETQRFIKTLLEAVKHVPFPERLPFERMFIGVGAGLDLTQQQVFSKLGGVPAGERRWVVVGLLVDGTGAAWELMFAEASNGEKLFRPLPLRTDGQWVQTVDLAPWVLSFIIDMFSTQQVTYEETAWDKKARAVLRRKRKKYGLTPSCHVPTSYYVINVGDRVTKERVKRSLSGTRGSPSYRTDVAGHERCRVRVGDEPIDGKLLEELLERGYRVYGAEGSLTPRDRQRLQRRGKLRRVPGQWLAIMTYFIKSHVSPANPNLPYVPAVRVRRSK